MTSRCILSSPRAGSVFDARGAQVASPRRKAMFLGRDSQDIWMYGVESGETTGMKSLFDTAAARMSSVRTRLRPDAARAESLLTELQTTAYIDRIGKSHRDFERIGE